MTVHCFCIRKTSFLLALQSVPKSLEAIFQMHTHLEVIPQVAQEHPLGRSTSPEMRQGTDQLPFKSALNRELEYPG